MTHILPPSAATWPPVRLGILSALPEELQALLDLMPDEHRETLAGRQFWRGHLAGIDVVAVVCGIGKVAAATTATLLWQRYGVTGLLFTGVAGGLGPHVRVGDMVVADALLQHDMNASPLFPPYEMPGYGRARFPVCSEWQTSLAQAARTVLNDLPQRLTADTIATFGLHQPQVHQGLVISGDRFVATSAESTALRLTLPDALAVEMEGAAVAQVCHDVSIPLAVIRTISDRADDSAHVDFGRFVQQVARSYSAQVVEHWLIHYQNNYQNSSKK
jgi:adenosylhomocysteine nucleosidase